MRIAILGDGLLGRSIFDVIAPREREFGEPPAVAMWGHADFDVTQPDTIKKAIDWFAPDVIVNTVAFHRLGECEADPDRAFAVNAIGAANVAALAPTIYVSSDYIFNDKGPHDESMPGQQPRSVYGQSKLAGELETLKHGGVVVRVAGLYHHEHASHKGPSFPDTVLGSFAPVRFPNDQRFSPTYAVDAAERIVKLAEFMVRMKSGGPSGIYHATGQGSTTWYEFATQIAEVARFKRTITGYAAKDPLRPTNSALESTRLPPLRHWRLALSAWSVERDRIRYANRVSPLREGWETGA